MVNVIEEASYVKQENPRFECHGFDGMTLDSAVMTTRAEKYH
jgi:hypothetical protein